MSTVRHFVNDTDRRTPISVRRPRNGNGVRAVWLTGTRPATGPEEALLQRWAIQARRTRGDVQAGLHLARDLGNVLPMPGDGNTAALWSVLATLAASDLTIARVVEPHLDALAIIRQLPAPPDLGPIGADDDSTWGVYAAEGPGQRLEARETVDGWVLEGTKPWCSLAPDVTHAIVTAWVPSGARRAFAVSLRAIGVSAEAAPWHARGLRAVTSGPVTFDAAAAVPVGENDWYLTRPGFAWGGMGVAACWYGGAVGVARALAEQAQSRELDQVGLMHLGAVDSALLAARQVLLDAARQIDAGRAGGATGALTALRVRTRVAATVDEVLTRAGHAMGPAPLCFSEEHAGRVADLQVYVRQHHAERDEAALGRALLDDLARRRGSETGQVDGWPW